MLRHPSDTLPASAEPLAGLEQATMAFNAALRYQLAKGQSEAHGTITQASAVSVVWCAQPSILEQ
jgi:hypothetical protein